MTESEPTIEPTEPIDPSGPRLALHRRKWQLAAVAAAALLVGYGGLILAVGPEVPAGTRVAGVNLGRMTYGEAAETLKPMAEEFGQQEITLRVRNRAITLTAAELGLEWNVQETLSEIQSAGNNPIVLLQQLLGGRDLPPRLQVNDAFFATVQTLAAEVDLPAREPTVEFIDDIPSLLPGRTGKVVDPAEAERAVLAAAYASDLKSEIVVQLTRRSDRPTVTDAAAQEVIDNVVTAALSGPVTITPASEDARPATFEPSEMRSAMRFRTVDGKLVVSLDAAMIRELTPKKFSAGETPVQNATWDVSSGKPVIVPAKAGFGISDKSLAEAIESVWLEPAGSRIATVQFGVLEPTFTTADAESMGITELVSSYTQNFPYAAYRSINIGQAAEYINGTLLAPGAEFSMNDTIKERTYENGYTDGWIIGGGGVFKMEPGGGVSAATTTMFNGAWFAGMKFVEWRAHSVYISRYPAGREATVFWGVLDMRFRNSHPTGIFITTKMTSTSMEVKFWGTKRWDEIGAESEPWINRTAASTIYSEDPECTGQDGSDGFQITVWRTFTKNEVEVKREAFRTTYRTSPTIICKAKPTPKPTKTKTKKPTPTATATPSPTPTTSP